MRLKLLFTLPCAMLLSCALHADTIIMKTGQTLSGKVLSQDDFSYEVEVEHGIVRVPKDKVLRVEEDTAEMIAERDEKEAADKELAEQMKDEGKVKHKGKWVTPEEKKKEDDKVAATKKKKEEQKVAARKKADAETAKKKEDEKKRLAEVQRANNALDADEDLRAERFGRRHGGNSSNNNGNSGRNSNRYNENGGGNSRNGSNIQSTGGYNANDLQRMLQGGGR